MSTAPPEIDEIRRKMAQIRRDLHEDVRGVVQGAEAATDWKQFIRNYPWASVGVALVVGYIIVPHRRRTTNTTTIQMAPAEMTRALAAVEPPKPVEAKKGKGLLGTIFGLVAPVAFRAAQGYALQFAEQWMAQKVAQQMQLHPDLAAAFGGQQSQAQAPGSKGPRVGPPGAPRF